MAYVPTRTATTGQLIGGTFDVLASSSREIAVYVAVFAGMGLLLAIDSVEGLVSTLSFLLYFPAQYWLCRRMLLRAGLNHSDQFRVFSLFGMAVLLGLALMVGFNIFWIPGIILGAKWVMAPSYLTTRDGNLFDAIGDAWRASDGNTLSLSLAYTAVGAIGLFVFWGVIIAASLTETVIADGSSLVSGPAAGLFLSVSINVLPIMMMALSVASYRLLSDEMEDLTEVFA
ncbi:hypothetical protein [Erythrobacter crassostreae]|uniref:Glycerophosphoryl diester phosphodiesterase membrane domain-containing protein n=1 Tax=Erythrobacter crassostreae TaxID=2828328 RepID=A0A9X1JL36_9SPHN|nr:hypothetical protein [Erythrobacter crassostrea]MBV7259735.1 hypothetical protein [Erythrobacter crassostrea]